MGPLLLCPIVLSCVTSPQITGRLWHKLQLRNLFPPESGRKTTLSPPHKFQLACSLAAGFTWGDNPQASPGSEHARPYLPPTAPSWSFPQMFVSHYQPWLWFGVISSFLTPHHILFYMPFKYIYIWKYQKEKAMGNSHLYMKTIFICLCLHGEIKWWYMCTIVSWTITKGVAGQSSDVPPIHFW